MKLKVQKTTELTNIDSFCIEHAERLIPLELLLELVINVSHQHFVVALTFQFLIMIPGSNTKRENRYYW